ncbi:hypothetical protein [Desulfospira joergensenii]|uniref:hypothetical protein n=1 Tax=Desulfospira joergensenii TaxID=53329 RepID=UPI0003B31DFC|nr:hypothetical protein [Desulfospira joergensenii]
MSYPLWFKKILVVSGLLLFAVSGFAQDDVMDNDVHAVLMLNKAASKHRFQSSSVAGPDTHTAKLRSYRNSNIAAHHQTDGSGVSLGNIYPANDMNRPHSTTVIVQGHIINSGK